MVAVVEHASFMVAIVEVDGVRMVGIQSRSELADHRHTYTPYGAAEIAEMLLLAARGIQMGVPTPDHLDPTASDEEIEQFIADHRTHEQLRRLG